MADLITSAAVGVPASPLLLADGTAAAPTYSFADEDDMGFFREAAGSLGVSVGGSLRWEFQATQALSQIAGSAAVPAIAQQTVSDAGIYWPSLNQVGLTAGSEAVIWDNDGSTPTWRLAVTGGIGELGEDGFRWGHLFVEAGTETDVSISVREVNTGIHSPAAKQLSLVAFGESVVVDNDASTPEMKPDTNNVWDLGTSSRKWRNIWAVVTNFGDINLRGQHDNAHWTITEDRKGIYVHDRRTGRAYRLVMEELDDPSEAAAPLGEVE